MTILDQLADDARIRVEKAKEQVSPDEMKETALRLTEEQASEGFRFEKALAGPEMGFICEVKKASPSRGVIAEHFPYTKIAKEYEAAGAECVSVLTEPKWFLGSNDYLRRVERNAAIIGAGGLRRSLSWCAPAEYHQGEQREGDYTA